MAADMSRVKYDKVDKGKNGRPSKAKSWKEERLDNMKAANPWGDGIKQYRELKPNAVFDIGTAQKLTK